MRVRSTVPSITIVVSSLLIVPQAFAHHSFAPHFDSSKPANISGTVTRYEARNPHSYLHIDAVDENGRTREYVCESHGVTQLTRIGITPQLFKPGTQQTPPPSKMSPRKDVFGTWLLAPRRNRGDGDQPPPMQLLTPTGEKAIA